MASPLSNTTITPPIDAAISSDDTKANIIVGAISAATVVLLIGVYLYSRHADKLEKARKARFRRAHQTIQAQTDNTQSTDLLLSPITPPRRALNFSLPMNHPWDDGSTIINAGAAERPATPAEMV